DVIVQFRHQPGPADHQKVIKRGGKLRRDLAFVKAGAYSVPASALQALASDPDVVYISPDRSVQKTIVADSSAALDYYAQTINARAASQVGYDGTGIGVAIIDSGVIDIPDFHNQHSRIVYAQDFVGGGTTDKYGHGSHVAGIVAGDGGKSFGSQYTYTFSGVAANANVINLRLLAQNGSGSDRSVIAPI